MVLEQVEPLTQTWHPAKPMPPHWPYLAVTHPTFVVVAAAFVVVDVVLMTNVVAGLAVVAWPAVVAGDVVTGLLPPPEAPHDQTAGPGTV